MCCILCDRLCFNRVLSASMVRAFSLLPLAVLAVLLASPASGQGWSWPDGQQRPASSSSSTASKTAPTSVASDTPVVTGRRYADGPGGRWVSTRASVASESSKRAVLMSSSATGPATRSWTRTATTLRCRTPRTSAPDGRYLGRRRRTTRPSAHPGHPAPPTGHRDPSRREASVLWVL